MKVLRKLKEQHDKSGGHCGLYLTELKRELNISQAKLKEELNELYKNKEISVCQGIHGKLIKYKL